MSVAPSGSECTVVNVLAPAGYHHDDGETLTPVGVEFIFIGYVEACTA
jgi:hypothetical protein